MYLRDLPETIRIPALDGNRPDEVVRRLEDATIDDVAFAIQGMESESRVHPSPPAAVCAISTKWPASAAHSA
jgi:hypothetical protein